MSHEINVQLVPNTNVNVIPVTSSNGRYQHLELQWHNNDKTNLGSLDDGNPPYTNTAYGPANHHTGESGIVIVRVWNSPDGNNNTKVDSEVKMNSVVVGTNNCEVGALDTLPTPPPATAASWEDSRIIFG